MSLSTELKNPLLYVKIKDYADFINKCHVGDTFVWRGIKKVITQISKNSVMSRVVKSCVVNQDGTTGIEMGLIISLGLPYGLPMYKYIGPTAEDIRQKQDNINTLYAFLVEARMKPIIEEGCIAFIGEDFREKQENDLAMEFRDNSIF